MLIKNVDLQRFESNTGDLSDFKDTELTNGSVFSVEAHSIRRYVNTRTVAIKVMLRCFYDFDSAYFFILANNQRESIPTQVELKLMELECAPTWCWTYKNGVYTSEFANIRNRKVISDSGSYSFPIEF